MGKSHESEVTPEQPGKIHRVFTAGEAQSEASGTLSWQRQLLLSLSTRPLMVEGEN